MVVKSQPELPKYARQPMPIGEKINLKFEVNIFSHLFFSTLFIFLSIYRPLSLCIIGLILGQIVYKRLAIGEEIKVWGMYLYLI